MNYYAACERKDGKFDYTCTNNRVTYPVGYCSPFHEWSEEDKARYGATDEYVAKLNAHRAKHHTDGHETKEQACNCYKEYVLDFNLRLKIKDENSQHRCQVCNEFTQLYALIDYQLFHLCEQHNNREEVAKLFSVGQCWSS